jgi:ribonuclease P protein component
MARKLRFSNGILILYMAENNCGYPRLGVSVGKSCGKVVVRNRLKRLLREVFRQNQYRIPSGFDYLLIPSPALSAKLKKGRNASGTEENKPQDMKFAQFEASFLALVSAAGKVIKDVSKSAEKEL